MKRTFARGSWDIPWHQESAAERVWSSQKKWSTGLARFFGIEVRIHLSLWVIFAAFLAVVLAGGDHARPGLILIRIGKLLVVFITLYGSILVHELAHAMVARRLQKPVYGIMLHPLGGAALIEIEASPSRHDFLMYLAGPAINLAMGAALAALPYSGIARLVSGVNLSIGIFNLAPVYPLDGSRIMREMFILRGLSPRAVDRVTLACTRWCSAGLVAYGIIDRDIFLTVIVLLLCLLGNWVLAENMRETSKLMQGPSQLLRAGGLSKKRPSMLIMILAFALILTQQTASEGDLKISPRLETLHLKNPLPLSQHSAARKVLPVSKKGKSKPPKKTAHSRHKSFEDKAAQSRTTMAGSLLDQTGSASP